MFILKYLEKKINRYGRRYIMRKRRKMKKDTDIYL